VKEWDLHTPAAKIEMALKTLQTTIGAVNERWNDQARRKFDEEHLSAIEPRVKGFLDALEKLAETLNAAQRQCGEEER
jgi:uncharacterized protein YukE